MPQFPPREANLHLIDICNFPSSEGHYRHGPSGVNKKISLDCYRLRLVVMLSQATPQMYNIFMADYTLRQEMKQKLLEFYQDISEDRICIDFHLEELYHNVFNRTKETKMRKHRMINHWITECAKTKPKKNKRDLKNSQEGDFQENEWNQFSYIINGISNNDIIYETLETYLAKFNICLSNHVIQLTDTFAVKYGPLFVETNSDEEYGWKEVYWKNDLVLCVLAK